MSIFLLSIFFLGSGAFASPVNNGIFDAVNLSIDLRDVLITEVFTTIEEKTEFTFVFDEKISSSKQPLTLIVKNENLETILSKISSITGFQFKRLNNTISVIKLEVPQQILRGKVIDNEGFPLPGATVMEKGTSNGTITDFDGIFSLKLSGKSPTMVISFMGFEEKEVIANSSGFQEITLIDDANTLNEVVVTALGIKREEKQ